MATGNSSVIRTREALVPVEKEDKLMENNMGDGGIKTIMIIATNYLISSYCVPDCAACSTWIVSLNHPHVPTRKILLDPLYR